MDRLTKLLEALKEILSVFGAFMLGYNEGQDEGMKLKKELLDEETKRKLLENEIENLKKFDESDPIDVVNDIAGRKRDP